MERNRDDFNLRVFGDDDPARTAVQSQTRALAMDSLRDASSFMLTTMDTGEKDVTSLCSFSREDPQIFATGLQATIEAVASTWFANHGTSDKAALALVGACIETIRATQLELEKGEEGE